MFLNPTNKNYSRNFPSFFRENSILIHKTMQVLEEKTMIPEQDYKNLVETYYQSVKQSMSNEPSNKLLKNIARLEYEEIQRNFKLIEEDYPKIDVFIEYNDEAIEIWKKFKKIKDVTDASERRRKFTSIKKQFRDYVISVPEKYKENAGYLDNLKMGYLSKMILDQTGVYDEQLGFLQINGVPNIFIV